MKRRAVLAGVPTALLVGGCTDLLSGDQTTFEADVAIVSDSARSETGYQERRVVENRIERNFESVDTTVAVVNVVAEYAREASIGFVSGELARFTVLSTPTVEVGPVGPLNPIKDKSNRELAEMVQQQYGGIQNVQQVGERDGTLLGSSVTVSKFSAQAQTGGQSVDVYLHLARTENEGDFVLAIGVHPQDVDEQSKIDRLLEGVEHPVDSVTPSTPSS